MAEDVGKAIEDSRLSGLMAPWSVAIIGASARKEGWSGSAIPTLQRMGFKGDIHPVNAKYDELNGLPCHASVADIPGPVDVALIFVPKAVLPQVLEECGRKGVKGAVILAAGFSETGEEGRALEDRIRTIANTHGIAVCGPNCLGLANLGNGFMGLTSATFPDDLSPGGTALISQSGQLMMVLLTHAHDQGAHLRYIVSTGNEMNVEAADYAGYALADPAVTSVAMVLEGLRDPARFLAVARQAMTAQKPLIVLKIGRSARAARTALAHTGKMAGAHRTYAAVFRQGNVIAVDDPMELAQVATLFEKCPPPRGERVGVVSFSGGWCGVIADQAETLGIELTDFTSETVARLRPLLDFTPPDNPLDLSGNVTTHPERWAEALEAVAADDNTDILVVFIHQVRAAWREGLIRPLEDLAARTDKPILVVYDGGKVVEEGYERLARARRLPIYRGTRPMLRALRHFLDFHARLSRAAKSAPMPEPAPRPAILDQVAGRSLSEYDAKALLREAGLPMVGEALCDDLRTAEEAARDIGFPVVLKGLADGMEHKTEAGLVRLGIGDAAGLRTAFEDLSAKLHGTTLNGGSPKYVVQQMISGGVEAIIGVQNDPDFGPMILVGVGGTLTELVGDVALRRAPLTPEDAAEMIDETRLAALLDGYRGAPPADRAALEDTIVRLSRFAVAHAAHIAEIDLNPVLVLPRGKGCVAVDALIVKTDGAA
ncbi:hypothetical protein BOO69_02970 [Sulfitobacter alexandrii]|uniref:ATP-grasp domain-containing protein n=1 Tax=Sulfitobacter alexandrii TaxID=1917485 RepID=A0A1J0WDV2_9RHOB|nr:acetate--CoA ligase family protein [Sulfitobacter alexandrii]APE42490.1 hypothetical protein BOO69_02970 [Sulfitobacter alexandrii]